MFPADLETNLPLSKHDAARILEVSPATVHNWVKKGVIAFNGRHFSKNQIMDLKRRIAAGDLPRLVRRANKLHSPDRFLPREYLSRPESAPKIAAVLKWIHEQEIPAKDALFFLLINRFRQSGDISHYQLSFPWTSAEIRCVRQGVEQLLTDYREDTKTAYVTADTAARLVHADLPEEPDILGLIYQSLLREGAKSRLGSYYTPCDMISTLCKDTLPPGGTVLDPCCGTGPFLRAYADRHIHPKQLVGFDIDPLAVFLARANLLLAFPAHDFSPQIYCQDFLALTSPRSSPGPGRAFDIIATNPPWGAATNPPGKNRLRDRFPGVHSGESFSYVICQAFRFLNPGGRLHIILPESFSNVKTHRDIRRYILDHARVQRVHMMGRRFQQVLSPVLAVSLQKQSPRQHNVRIEGPDASYRVPQSRFRGNPDCLFDIHATQRDRRILDKLEEREHVTLADNADWTLGIVTGDNRQYVRDQPVDSSYEPVYTGTEVRPYCLKPPVRFLRFTPERFQQTGAEKLYRKSPKLVYKFVSRDLIVALDDSGALTLNSANVVIPRLPEYSILSVLGVLNSRLFRFWYRSRFHALKVLRGNLERLPFPVLSPAQNAALTTLVAKARRGHNADEVDRFVFHLVGLPGDEVDYVCRHTPV